MLDVGFDPFVRRQTPNSRFSYTTLTDEQVLQLIKLNWERRKPGYRPEVVLVPVAPAGFFSNIAILQVGDKLVGGYEPRQEGEDPRKFTVLASTDDRPVAERKLPAVFVDIVLYHRDALLEDIKPGEPEPGYEWNIVSINANLDADTPIEPGVLIANHLHLSGGTETKMTDEQFVAQLRQSVRYWKDKSHIG